MKLQSAIEFLTTYTWAFMIITAFIVVAIAFVLVKNPSSPTPSSCFIAPEFPCYSVTFFTNVISTTMILTFSNQLGQTIQFANNGIFVYPSFNGISSQGACFPVNAPQGATVVCNATSTGYTTVSGTQVSPKFTLSYQICSGGTCAPLVAANAINTSGFATTVATPYLPGLLKQVTLQTSGAAKAYVEVSGVKYISGNSVYFVGNNLYSFYGVPPNSMFAFGSWSSTGGVVLSSTASQNTIANAVSAGTITANFVTTTSTTTTSTSTTSVGSGGGPGG